MEKAYASLIRHVAEPCGADHHANLNQALSCILHLSKSVLCVLNIFFSLLIYEQLWKSTFYIYNSMILVCSYSLAIMIIDSNVFVALKRNFLLLVTNTCSLHSHRKVPLYNMFLKSFVFLCFFFSLFLSFFRVGLGTNSKY